MPKPPWPRTDRGPGPEVCPRKPARFKVRPGSRSGNDRQLPTRSSRRIAMRYVMLSFALLAGVAASACEQSHSPSVQESVAPSLSNGATVVHFIEPQIFAFVDFE